VGVDVQVTCLVMEGGGAMDATEGETHSTSRHISGGELTRGFRSRETSPRRDAPSAVALKAACFEKDVASALNIRGTNGAISGKALSGTLFRGRSRFGFP
jgi:hypothetical protein